MAKGFKCGGSSGDSLNVRIQAFATETALNASTPRDNTIGVVTTTAINGWYVNREAPQSPASGMVWIKTGNSSQTIRVVRNADILVAPLAAYQYNGRSWDEKTAKLFQGSWKSLAGDKTYLFKNGNQFTSVTGGWYLIASGSAALEVGQEKEVSSYEEIVPGTNTEKLVDMRGYSRLCVNIDDYAGTAFALIGNGERTTLAVVVAQNPGVVSIDLSNFNGSYHVAIGARDAGEDKTLRAGVSCSEVWLER